MSDKEKKETSVVRILKDSPFVPAPISKEYLQSLIDECLAIKDPSKGGRPTIYDPDKYIPIILKSAGEGKDLATMAVDCQISWSTFQLWCQEHEEFSAAIKFGQKLAKSWWTEMGRSNLLNDKFNNTLYMMNMQNRWGWTRKLDASIKKEEHTIVENRNTTVIKVQKDEEMAEVLQILIDNDAIELPQSTEVN